MADSSDRSIELTPEQASAVARAIAAFRADKPTLTNGAIQRRGEASQPTVTDLTKGVARPYLRTSLQKVSIGVGWTPDSIEQIIRGGEATVAGPEHDDEEPGDHERRLIEVERRLDQLDARLDEVLALLRAREG